MRFLGLLHLEIIQVRLEREIGIDIVATAPNVTYKISKTNGEVIMIDNPNDFPLPQQIDKIEEPFVGLSVIAPNDYMGAVMELSKEHRAIYIKSEFIDSKRQNLIFQEKEKTVSF